VVGDRIDGSLFVKKNGNKVDDRDLRKSLEKARNRLIEEGYKNAKKIHLHTFRHFYASKLYHKTKDLLAVKTALGHNSINSTEIYTHLLSKLEWKTETMDIGEKGRIAQLIREGWDVALKTNNYVILKTLA